jgi:mono/diheme cytochrome c family protein
MRLPAACFQDARTVPRSLFPAAVVALGLSLGAAGAWPQVTDKPGPMQSGQHVQDAPGDKGLAAAPPGPTGTGAASFDVNQLFAGSCGWCHFKGGRENGKGPKLMGTTLTDAEIVSRIRNGKPGQMPAFGSAFSDDQMRAIVAYIRELKP